MAEGPMMDGEDREFFDKRFREIAERLEAKGLTPSTSIWWSAEVEGTVYKFGIKSYCKSRGSRLGQQREQEAAEAMASFNADQDWSALEADGPVPPRSGPCG